MAKELKKIFEQPTFASKGGLKEFNDEQRAKGWESIGKEPPESTQFNVLQNDAERGIKYLYAQIREAIRASSANYSPDEQKAIDLRDAIASTIKSQTAQGIQQAKDAAAAANKNAEGRLAKTANLADVANKSKARSNLELGTAATKNVGTEGGNVMQVGAFGLGVGPQHRDNAYSNAAQIYRINGTSVSSPGSGVYGVVSLPCDGGPAGSYLAIQANGIAYIGWSNKPENGVAWTQIFTAKNPPTAADVGAYSKEEMDELLHGRLLNVQKFTESGTYTPTPGTRYVIVEAVGGGGGGGGCSSTNGNTAAISGGGASGSYIRAKIDITKVGGSIGVSIGAGGSGGVAGKSGGAGGDTRFGVLATATGGLGGTSSTSASSTALVAVGGAPGSTPTGGNLISSQGSRGGSGIFFNSSTGAVGGDGASSPLGGGGVGSGSSGTTGTNGSGFGAGGGGNARQPSSAANNGYSGSPGILIICEYS